MTQGRYRRLTHLEGVIMQCVWDLSEATVRQVQEHLRPTRPLAYNTVLTMMGILRDKGFLRSRREGRADVYQPCITRQQVVRVSLRELCDRFFAGSVHGLVSAAIEADGLTAEEIRAIRRAVDRRLRAKGGKGVGT